jgi:hypothetical protein
MTNKPSSEDAVKDAIERYQRGEPVWDILGKTGVKYNEFYLALRKYGVPLKRPGKARNPKGGFAI